MKNDVILKKMQSLAHCLQRLEEKRPEKLEDLLDDYDLQDIISINLERSVQLSVDIGLQALLELKSQPPETMAEVFTILGTRGIISPELAEQLKSAVGFRNIAVHEYKEIDWKIVFSLLNNNLSDFNSFMKMILSFTSG